MGLREGIKAAGYSKPASDIERGYFEQLIKMFAQRRREKGLSQEDLDDRLGVAPGQVAKWECFLRLPGAFMLVCWGNALDLSVIAILERKTGE